MDTKITPAAARVNAGLTQAQAAEQLGISIGALRRYEAGMFAPRLDTVQKMEQLYDWPASRIVFGKELIKGG